MPQKLLTHVEIHVVQVVQVVQAACVKCQTVPPKIDSGWTPVPWAPVGSRGSPHDVGRHQRHLIHPLWRYPANILASACDTAGTAAPGGRTGILVTRYLCSRENMGPFLGFQFLGVPQKKARQ